MNIEPDIMAEPIKLHRPPRYAPDSTREGGEDWREQALCAQIDPELFHPEEKGASIAAARKICRACPVTAACLEEHITEQYGVFGNTSAKQRQALRKARAAAALPGDAA